MHWQNKMLQLSAIASSVILACYSTNAMSVDVPLAPQTLEQIASKRIIVSWDSSESTKDDLLNMMANASEAMGVGVSYTRKSTLKNVHILTVNTDTTDDVDRMMSEMGNHGSVQWIEKDTVLKAFKTPNDPNYALQWHYFDPASGLNLPNAWDVTAGEGTVVAVLDTGILPHADIAANLLPGADTISLLEISNDGDGRDQDATDAGDFTVENECAAGSPARSSSWHGLHVAGTVAAVSDNNLGVAGVAYGAKIVPVRVLGKCGGLNSDIIDAMIWASGGTVQGLENNANPADVINMSLGGGGACGNAQQIAIDQVRQNGTVIVVAAGNSNANVANFNPASCNGVISVAAVGKAGNRAVYSNFGNLIDVAAPGGDQIVNGDATEGVLSTLNSGQTTAMDDNLAYYQGTSMASPHVAGAAALIRSIKPEATPDEVETIIKTSVRPFVGVCNDCGTGLVDAEKAIVTAATVQALPSFDIEATEDTTQAIELDTILATIQNGPFTDSMIGLKLMAQPANGEIHINGEAAAVDTVYAKADIQSIEFIPNADASGTDEASWRFMISTVETEADVKSVFNVANVNDAPALSAPFEKQSIDVNQSFTLDISSLWVDVDQDALSFKATGLPEGLVLTSAGVLSGSPTETGDFDVTIEASDGTVSTSEALALSVSGDANSGEDTDGGGLSALEEAGNAGGLLTLLFAPLFVWRRKKS